jgi:hypothetical protein
MAFYRIEPWGPERADLNAGIIASTIANCHRDSTKRPEPFAPADFMPKFGEPEQEDDGGEDDGGLEAMRRLMRHQEQILGRRAS